MDIYRKDQDINDVSLVKIGRIAGFVGLVTSIIVAPIFLGSLDSAFQYVQEYMGLFSPVILFVFLSAIFLRNSTTRSVLEGAFVALALGVILKLYVANNPGSAIEPFMHQMAISFVAAFLVNYFRSPRTTNEKVFNLTRADFNTSKLFNIGSITILVILGGIYSFYW